MSLLALILSVFALYHVATVTPSVNLTSDSVPTVGNTVRFVGVYPNEARQKVGRQQQYNPDVQVDCYQNGVRVYTENNAFFNETKNSDGSWTGISGDVLLTQPGDCTVTLYYFSKDPKTHALIYNFLAYNTFTASP